MCYRKEPKVNLHSSCCFKNLMAQDGRGLPPWILFEELHRGLHSMFGSIRTCTMVTPVTVFLFAGPRELSKDCKETDCEFFLSVFLLHDRNPNLGFQLAFVEYYTRSLNCCLVVIRHASWIVSKFTKVLSVVSQISLHWSLDGFGEPIGSEWDE